ncbi:MAG: response regulator [Chloroflexota bacterium]
MYIMIVEDQPEIAANLQEMLVNEGHETQIAPTIADARAVLDNQSPDIVFLDIYLPDGSGLDLLEYADSIRFIIMTGTPREESLNTSFNSGAVAYLVKPFTLEDVLDAITLTGES